jgi:hypothetical protein
MIQFLRPRQVYRWTRDLHLYIGLFISPFVLVFAVSVFFLNHAKLPAAPPTPPQVFGNLQIADGIERLTGPEAVARARDVLPQVGLTGEIGFVRVIGREHRVVFPVSQPGFEATVDLDVEKRSAVVTRSAFPWWQSLVYLHKTPGPHNANIRGNWVWTRVWGWLADTTIYLTLFITVSGLYLWFAIKAERRTGMVLLGTGALAFSGLIYAVLR